MDIVDIYGEQESGSFTRDFILIKAKDFNKIDQTKVRKKIKIAALNMTS